MSMDPNPPQMMINPSKISLNYLVSNPSYPEELSIPPITVNPTKDPLLANSGNTNTFKETWQTHFCREQLYFQDMYIKAHQHPTWIYNPTLGLTSTRV